MDYHQTQCSLHWQAYSKAKFMFVCTFVCPYAMPVWKTPISTLLWFKTLVLFRPFKLTSEWLLCTTENECDRWFMITRCDTDTARVSLWDSNIPITTRYCCCSLNASVYNITTLQNRINKKFNRIFETFSIEKIGWHFLM